MGRRSGPRQSYAPPYDRVDPQILWEVISGDLPKLKAVCRAAIASLEDRPK
tara:strand:+ start:355 stop:507 length:153 start_codon:yes stop_codon:yes gene_type:complete